jgi:tyrosine-protein phosphatase SIW14
MNLSKTFGALAVVAFALSPAWSADGVPGVPNFHQVNEHVFRGGQPSAEAWPNLAKLGVKTVVDLREPGEHSTAQEAEAVTAAGMKYVNIPMKGVVSPSNEQISKALGLLDSNEPVFVHCRRGADRTGTVIACYRISHDGWQNKQALHEAKSFGMSWTQVGLKSYVKSFQPARRVAAAPEAQPATARP